MSRIVSCVKKSREVNGQVIETKEAEILSLNTLEVEVGTNGLKGGDSGHGCRTYFRIEDLGSTDIKVNLIGESGVEIILGGDCELMTFIEALVFAARTLESQTMRVK